VVIENIELPLDAGAGKIAVRRIATGGSVLTQRRGLRCRAGVVQLASVAIVTDGADAAVDGRLRVDAGARIETRINGARIVPRAVIAVPTRSTAAPVGRVTGRDTVALLTERLARRQADVHLATFIAVEAYNTVSSRHTIHLYHFRPNTSTYKFSSCTP